MSDVFWLGATMGMLLTADVSLAAGTQARPGSHAAAGTVSIWPEASHCLLANSRGASVTLRTPPYPCVRNSYQ